MTGQSLVRQKAYYDRKIHGEKFNTGDLVWLWNPAVPRKEGYNCKKLHRVWQGPFEVIKRLSDDTYRIQHTAKKRQRQVGHFDRLKPCNPDVRLHKVTQPTQEPTDNHGTMSTDDADTEDDVGEVPMSVSNTKEQEAEEQSVEVDDVEDAQDVVIAEQPQEMHQEGQIEQEAEKLKRCLIHRSTLSSESDHSENPIEQRRTLLGILKNLTGMVVSSRIKRIRGRIL